MNPTEFSDSEKEKPEKTPKSEVQTVFQELQFMAMQKGTPNQFDLNKLDKEQLDKVLNTMAESFFKENGTKNPIKESDDK